MKGLTLTVYGAISGACLLLHNVVLIVTNAIGISLWLSVLMSFGLVASMGYVLHSLFTFKRPIATASYARYFIAMSANVPLAFVTTWAWHDLVGFPMPIAAPVATACMIGFNFVLSRWAIAPAKN